MSESDRDTRSSYELVAHDYAVEFAHELDKKPFDRKMLEFLIEKVDARSTICDMGCGPGQIAGYLKKRRASVCGIDLSIEMVRQARKLNPGIDFSQGNMLSLTEVEDCAFGGIAAFYSIIHIERGSVVEALLELKRVLRPGGVLLLAFHIGSETIHRDEWWGKAVSLDFFFFETQEMKDYLSRAHFELLEVIERDPYRDVEYQSRRAYIFARKPPGPEQAIV